MDQAGKIIKAVQSRTPLWDTRDKKYHSRDIQKHLWAKVAKEVGSEVRTVKKKWKGLRDSFRRENKKILKTGQAAPNKNLSSWPFYRQMLFLSDIMETRESKRNLTQPIGQSLETNVEGSGMDDNSSDQLEQDSEKTAPLPSTPSGWRIVQVSGANGTLKKQTRDDDRDARLLALEEANFKLLSENTAMEDDSDNQFLRSLLPFLKNVPDKRKLIVRNKLMQVLIDEQKEQHST